MNQFDMAALLLMVSAALRGYRNGLAIEGYRLFRMLVALLAGSSIYGLLNSAMSGMLDHSSSWLDPVIFVGSIVVIWKLLKQLRRWMEALIAARIPQRFQSIGGSLAAGAKAAVLIGGIITMFNLADWLPGHNVVARDSKAAHLMSPFLSSPE